MVKTYKNEERNVSDLIGYANNSRTHSDEQVLQIASSIKEFGFTNPVLIDEENGIIAGHGRIMAAKKLGIYKVPCIILDGLSKAQKKAYVIADNQLALNADWNMEMLKIEIDDLADMDFDIDLLGFDDEFLGDLDLEIDDESECLTDEDDVPEPPVEPISKRGDVWILGNHRLMCGDSTIIDDVEKLMDGQRADMVFTDPPYGMKKENEGVLNDNLNYDDLLEFNKQWIPLSFAFIKDNGSWYCWGIDEPIIDIYSNIIKPMIKCQQATFRNLITWDKGHGQGQNSDNTRSYAIADEKCLFVMCGVQGFNNNADNYFDGFDSIVNYLKEEKEKSGLTIKDFKRIAGHSENSGCHWFDKSQWMMPTREAYESWQNYCGSDTFKKEYDELKKEYDELKKEYYSTRAYFNNTHDNFNNVWHFDRHVRDGSEGGHATPKPIKLCDRAIKSSSDDGDVVFDMFGGSGSTIISCEGLGRKAFLMELDEKYVDVIINRWQSFTGKEAIHEETGKRYSEIVNG